MSVIGINKEKCSGCKLCILECRRGYFYMKENGDMEFNGELNTCNICGHCIAICPEDAILLKDLDDVDTYVGIDAPETIIGHEKMFRFIRAKRSIRSYKNKKVPKESIKKIFEAMRYAPSASNARLWRYLIISDPLKIKSLSHEVMKVRYQYLGFKSGEEAINHFKSIDFDPIFYKAPHLIILYFKTVQKNMIMLGLWGNDTGIALTYGMLTAESLGLGTCWIGNFQVGVAINRDILSILGIKGHVFGAFTLGFPAVKYRRTTPRPQLKIKGLEEL